MNSQSMQFGSELRPFPEHDGELSCPTNIVFMALCGDVHPDHTTIARFMSGRSTVVRRKVAKPERHRRGALLADTNYFSEANARFVFTNGSDGYLPDHHFRSRDPRLIEGNRGRRNVQERFPKQALIYDCLEHNIEKLANAGVLAMMPAT